MRLAVLVACHNRRELTRRMLGSLLPQLRGLEGVKGRVFLLDDASRDGTAEMAAGLGEDVEVLHGDGQRYWSGGMLMSQRAAQAWGAERYLLVNDDLELDPDALTRLLRTFEALEGSRSPGLVLAGALRDEAGGIAYSGVDFAGRWWSYRFTPVVPEQEPVRCETVSGNLLLVSAATLDEVSPFSYFRGAGADFYLGLAATRRGGACFVAPGSYGHTSTHATAQFDPDLSLAERIKATRSPMSPNLAEQVRIARLLERWRWPLWVARRYQRILFPAPRQQARRVARRLAGRG